MYLAREQGSQGFLRNQHLLHSKVVKPTVHKCNEQLCDAFFHPIPLVDSLSQSIAALHMQRWIPTPMLLVNEDLASKVHIAVLIGIQQSILLKGDN